MLRRTSNHEAATGLNRTTSEKEWTREGWKMASHEDEGALESIEIKHEAETKEHFVHAEEIKAHGRLVLERRNKLQEKLAKLQFDIGSYSAMVSQGRIDFYCAIGLTILNATLGIFVFCAFGPVWMATFLSFLVLATAVPVEKFFQSYDDHDVFREGVFLVLAIMALGTQFYLGSIRGLFLAAMTPVASGAVSQFFVRAAPILRYALGILASISECLCGYEFYRARTVLGSTVIHTAREHSRCDATLVALHRNLEKAKAEPDIRRSYRLIGARQYLASKERLQKRFAERHLVRALIGALIAIGVIVLLLFFVPSLMAASPEGHVNAVLLDLSKSVPTPNFDANLAAVPLLVEKMGVRDRIVVVGIADSFGNAEILFDRTLPADDGFMGLQLAAAREQVVADWRTASSLVSPRRRYNQTDILGAIRFLAFLGMPANAQTRLFIFSDMRQSTPEFELERVSMIPIESELRKIQRMGQVAALPGVRVYVLGVDVQGTTDRYFTSLKDFWLSYFKTAGADVRAYQVNRTIPAF